MVSRKNLLPATIAEMEAGKRYAAENAARMAAAEEARRVEEEEKKAALRPPAASEEQSEMDRVTAEAEAAHARKLAEKRG